MKERKKIKCLTLIDQELIEIFSLNPDESSTPFILLCSFIDTWYNQRSTCMYYMGIPY